MSEKLIPRGESAEFRVDTSQESKKLLEKLSEQAAETAVSAEQIQGLQDHVEQQAVSAKEFSTGEQEQQAAYVPGLHRDLKQSAYKRTLERTQNSLNGPEKALSKVIHAPVVETISTVTGNTVARPSGILGGSIFALIGTLLLTYFTRRYGFSYNYLIFVILFAGGFTAGLIVELFIHLIRKAR